MCVCVERERRVEMAATLSVCRGRRSNRNIFDLFKLLGQRRNITIQAAPTLDVLSHELNSRAKIGSSGLPNACSTKSAILSKNFNVFNEYGYSISFGVKEKAKRGPHPNLMRVHNYATKSEKAEKQHLKRGRIIKEGAGEFPELLFTGNRDYLVKYNGQQIFRSVATINKASSRLRASPQIFRSVATINKASSRLRASPQGDRAYFHTTRMSSRSRKISPNLKRGDKMKFELRLDNTRSGFGIHHIVPVEIKGKKVVRLYNDDRDFVMKWLPYTTSIVKNQPAKLRDLMDRYWLLPPHEDHDYIRAYLMLRYGVHPQDFVPHFDNYWEETVEIALPFFQENEKHYLGKIYEDFPREGRYGCKKFVEGLSRIAGKEVAVEFYDDVYTEALGVRLLFDEEKTLMNHPEHGTKCPYKFDLL